MNVERTTRLGHAGWSMNRNLRRLTYALPLMMLSLFSVASDLSTPVPWLDGERLHFQIQENSKGPVVGNAIFTITKGLVDTNPVWRIRFQVISDQSAMSIVTVDQKQFLPVYSLYRSDTLGEVEAEYKNGGVSIEHRLKRDSKHYRQSGRTYDFYQSCYLMRQFPIEDGFQRRVYVVNSRQPMKQIPTVMRIVSIETIMTPMGRVKCYRVDSKMDDSRRSFWFGVDDRRLLYRMEEESGAVLQLTAVTSSRNNQQNRFKSEKFGYSLELPDDWFAFVRGGTSGRSPREYVVFMLPDMQGEFSLIRHQKFGEIDAVVKGSIEWLSSNREHFRLQTDTEVSFQANGIEGISFRGEYIHENATYGIYNAVLAEQDGLYIFTGNGRIDGFSKLVETFGDIVNSMRFDADKKD